MNEWEDSVMFHPSWKERSSPAGRKKGGFLSHSQSMPLGWGNQLHHNSSQTSVWSSNAHRLLKRYLSVSSLVLLLLFLPARLVSVLPSHREFRLDSVYPSGLIFPGNGGLCRRSLRCDLKGENGIEREKGESGEEGWCWCWCRFLLKAPPACFSSASACLQHLLTPPASCFFFFSSTQILFLFSSYICKWGIPYKWDR